MGVLSFGYTESSRDEGKLCQSAGPATLSDSEYILLSCLNLSD